MTNELWKPVPGYEGYYSISDLGRVRRDKSVTRAKAGHIMKQTLSRDGYWQVPLSRDGKPKGFRVHRLVYAAHVGPIPEGYVVNHINGDKADPTLSNLEAVTKSENILHAFRDLGRRRPGEKLTTDIAVAMREARAAGTALKDLATKHNVTQACVSGVCTGKTWKHAGGPITPSRRMSQTPQQAQARISETDIAAAVRRRMDGETYSAIARDFAVSAVTVRNWCTGKTRTAI